MIKTICNYKQLIWFINKITDTNQTKLMHTPCSDPNYLHTIRDANRFFRLISKYTQVACPIPHTTYYHMRISRIQKRKVFIGFKTVFFLFPFIDGLRTEFRRIKIYGGKKFPLDNVVHIASVHWQPETEANDKKKINKSTEISTFQVLLWNRSNFKCIFSCACAWFISNWPKIQKVSSLNKNSIKFQSSAIQLIDNCETRVYQFYELVW